MAKINTVSLSNKVRPSKRMSTALDVSRLAGVARSTVSRAITDPKSVKGDTLLKIQEAMHTLKYRPSAFGRGLVSGRQGVIGVITDTQIYNHRRDGLIDGIDGRINSHYWLGTSSVQRAVTEKDLEKLPLISQHTCDGFVFNIETSEQDLGAFCRKHSLPAIFVNPVNFIPYDSVVLDDQSTTQDAVKYLVSKGHKRIAYLTGVGHSHDLSLRKRENGYELAMLRGGLVPMPHFTDRLVWDIGEERIDAVERRVKEWLALEGYPTVILAYDYNLAMDLIRASYKNKWDIPDRFSVMVCDDAPFLNDVVVPVTAMHTNWDVVGKDAVEMLLRKIERPDEEIENMVVKSHVIERQSVVKLL